MKMEIKEEGHYEDNKKCKWWIFYESNRKLIKSEFKKRSIKWLFFILQKNNIIREKIFYGKK
jgi:hypothetical protein